MLLKPSGRVAEWSEASISLVTLLTLSRGSGFESLLAEISLTQPKVKEVGCRAALQLR